MTFYEALQIGIQEGKKVGRTGYFWYLNGRPSPQQWMTPLELLLLIEGPMTYIIDNNWEVSDYDT